MILFGITEKHEIITNYPNNKITNINFNIGGRDRIDKKAMGKSKSKL